MGLANMRKEYAAESKIPYLLASIQNIQWV